MSMTRKEQIKSLKGPDAFQVRVMTALDWVNKNSRKVVLALVPVLAIAAAGVLWQYVAQRGKEGRLAELGKVQLVYDEELRKAQTGREQVAKQLEAVELKLQKDAGGATPDAKLTAEKQALEKQIESVKPDHSASLVGFQEYFSKNEGHAEGWMAGMTAARLLIDQDKLSEARAILEKVVQNAGSNSFYQVQARLPLIGVLEESGDYAKALTELDALDKLVDKDFKPKVLLAKGRIQMLENKKDDAKATFDALIKDFATSPEAQKARSIQSLLN